MNLYTIGDLHLSFGCDKPMDIFSGWADYTQKLEKNWNDTVTDEDTVVIVGDISWAMTLDEAKPDFDFINKLRGNKIILKGNHDYWFSTKRKVDIFLEENGFDTIKILFNNAFEFKNFAICGTRGWINEKGESVDKKVLNREAGRLKISLEMAKSFNKTPIAFLHYPPVYYITECEEIMDVLKEYDVRRCFYGHIHGAGYRYAIDGDYKGISMRLVSCDYTQFRPIKVL